MFELRYFGFVSETKTMLSSEKNVAAKLAHVIDREKERNQNLAMDIERLENEKSMLRDQLDKGDLILMTRAAELEAAMEKLQEKTEKMKELTGKNVISEKEFSELKEEVEDLKRSGSVTEEVRFKRTK